MSKDNMKIVGDKFAVGQAIFRCRQDFGRNSRCGSTYCLLSVRSMVVSQAIVRPSRIIEVGKPLRKSIILHFQHFNISLF